MGEGLKEATNVCPKLLYRYQPSPKHNNEPDHQVEPDPIEISPNHRTRAGAYIEGRWTSYRTVTAAKPHHLIRTPTPPRVSGVRRRIEERFLDEATLPSTAETLLEDLETPVALRPALVMQDEQPEMPVVEPQVMLSPRVFERPLEELQAKLIDLRDVMAYTLPAELALCSGDEQVLRRYRRLVAGRTGSIIKAVADGKVTSDIALEEFDALLAEYTVLLHRLKSGGFVRPDEAGKAERTGRQAQHITAILADSATMLDTVTAARKLIALAGYDENLADGRCLADHMIQQGVSGIVDCDPTIDLLPDPLNALTSGLDFVARYRKEREHNPDGLEAFANQAAPFIAKSAISVALVTLGGCVLTGLGAAPALIVAAGLALGSGTKKFFDAAFPSAPADAYDPGSILDADAE